MTSSFCNINTKTKKRKIAEEKTDDAWSNIREVHGPPKKEKKGFESKAPKGPKSQGEGQEGKDVKKNERKANFGKDLKKTTQKMREAKKKQMTEIVTEAKANYQLMTDKNTAKDEKLLLKKSTYDLVKNNIPELARMKGMGKVISSLLDPKSQKEMLHILKCYGNAEERLLLMKGNGFKLAIKLVKLGTPKTIRDFADACLSNTKGLRALMTNFKAARCLSAIYSAGNAEIKKQILRKLIIGNMPISNNEGNLEEVFASCKNDIIEGCKTFIESILNEKSIEQELIQDIMAMCLKTQKLTDADVESLVSTAADNILQLCRRESICALPMWVGWLSSAQIRKKIMKNLKGKVSKVALTHNGRMFLMALIESTDDTKALDKFVLKELVEDDDLVQQPETRKLLEFILLPRSTKFMHPKEIETLKQGDTVRTSKKSDETRFEEIRGYMQESMLESLKKNCSEWLKDNKLCLFIIAIIQTYGSDFDSSLLETISSTLTSPEFSERIADKAVRMVLDALLIADVKRCEQDDDAALFINYFVPALEAQADTFVKNCPQPVSRMLETTEKVEAKLEFKLKKTWLGSAKTQKAITLWRKQKPVFVKNTGPAPPKIERLTLQDKKQRRRK